MEIKTLSLKFDDKTLAIIDQSLLPHTQEWITLESIDQTVEAIQKLKVRGAPLIGIVAALSLGLWALKNPEKHQTWWDSAKRLKDSRPTAVNLIHHMNEMQEMIVKKSSAQELFTQAQTYFQEDQKMCATMANYGLELLKDKKQVLTHCNTGSLATAGEGTALGVIKKWWPLQKDSIVYVDETRPLLQGARLTAWELEQVGANYQIICDNMAGFLMQQKKVDAVILGADRITVSGDTANKIGTYSLAVLCQYHKIPFYVVAPLTSFDLEMQSGEQIPIELRSEQEVKGFRNTHEQITWSPKKAKAYNPAFDWVPADLISAWVTEAGVFRPEDIKQGALNKIKEL